MKKVSELTKFLNEKIPVTKALDVKVISAEFDKVILKAPLHSNHNHMGTAFGGSISMLLILSGYTWLYNRMNSKDYSFHVILKKSEVDYLLPITEDLVIECQSPSEKDFEKFFKLFERKGRAKIVLNSVITTSEGVASKMMGEFVAQKES